MHVLFVCTGNICRSPTAERLAAAYAKTLGFQAFRSSSAGTRAVIGQQIHPHALTVLRDLGADPTNFAARQLTAKIVSGVDLTVTMTAAHRDAVLEVAPQKLNRTFTLWELSRLVSELGAQTVAELPALRPQLTTHERVDVFDPIGHDVTVFAAVAAQIAELVPPVVELCHRSSTRAVDE